jgi:hypothetical protein
MRLRTYSSWQSRSSSVPTTVGVFAGLIFCTYASTNLSMLFCGRVRQYEEKELRERERERCVRLEEIAEAYLVEVGGEIRHKVEAVADDDQRQRVRQPRLQGGISAPIPIPRRYFSPTE